MLFQEPSVEFVVIDTVMITGASNEHAGYTLCQKKSGGNITRGEAYCNQVEMPSVENSEYCEIFVLDPSIMSDGWHIDDVTNDPGKVMRQEVNPQLSTQAPVRSAPHFNNDLFN